MCCWFWCGGRARIPHLPPFSHHHHHLQDHFGSRPTRTVRLVESLVVVPGITNAPAAAQRGRERRLDALAKHERLTVASGTGRERSTTARTKWWSSMEARTCRGELRGCLQCSRFGSAATLRTHELFPTLMRNPSPNTSAKIWSWSRSRTDTLRCARDNSISSRDGAAPLTPLRARAPCTIVQSRVVCNRYSFTPLPARHPRGPKPKSFSQEVC